MVALATVCQTCALTNFELEEAPIIEVDRQSAEPDDQYGRDPGHRRDPLQDEHRHDERDDDRCHEYRGPHEDTGKFVGDEESEQRSEIQREAETRMWLGFGCRVHASLFCGAPAMARAASSA